MHDGDSISGPRPVFRDNEDTLKKGVKRLKMGGKTAGIVMDASRKGIEINGYYTGFGGSEVIYACTSEPIEMEWGELEKLRKIIFSTKKKKQRDLKPYGVASYKIDEPSKKYLESLPIVTINNKKYYIDAENRLRRPIEAPQQAHEY